MEQCLRRKAPVPQWYVVRDGGRLLAGAGVIANDFHDRKDLTPNLCALFVEPPGGAGTAGRLLDFIRRDLGAMGDPRLYLVTDHTAFYERYGWTFLTMVTGDDHLPGADVYRPHPAPPRPAPVCRRTQSALDIPRSNFIYFYFFDMEGDWMIFKGRRGPPPRGGVTGRPSPTGYMHVGNLRTALTPGSSPGTMAAPLSCGSRTPTRAAWWRAPRTSSTAPWRSAA